jgi:hypothetical protein
MDDVAPLASVLEVNDKYFWTAKNHETGIGECTFDNGDKYVGHYNGNAMHGQGIDLIYLIIFDSFFISISFFIYFTHLFIFIYLLLPFS